MNIFIIISISIIALILIGILVWIIYFLPEKIKYYAREQAHLEVIEHETDYHLGDSNDEDINNDREDD